MKNLTTVFFLFFLTFIACKPSKRAAIITLETRNYGETLVFFRTDEETDTIKATSPGKFSILIEGALPTFGHLKFSGTEDDIILLVDSAEQINVFADVNNIDSSLSISGSPGSTLLVNLAHHYNSTIERMTDLKREFNQKVALAGEDTMERLAITYQSRYNVLIEEEASFLKDFVEKNYSSMAAMSALYQSFDASVGRPLLMDATNGLSYFIMVDTALCRKYPSSKIVNEFHQGYINMKMNLSRDSSMTKSTATHTLIKPGDQAPDFKLQTPEGKHLRLSDFRGKVLLLDFWASWCVPCRRENIHLKEIYNRYRASGFDVLQVSLDKTRDAWIQAIGKEELPWENHGCDFKFWDSEPAVLYDVKSIPATFLIGRDGTVIARQLKGNDLDKAVEAATSKE